MKLFGSFKEFRRGGLGLLFLLLISLGIKVTLLLTDGVINVDGVRFIDAARQFAEGNFLDGLSIEKMPFYPLLIVAIHFLVRDWMLAGQLISLFSLVLAVIPLYLLTKEIFDEKVAFWAGLAFALSPMLNAHAVDLIRDPIFIFFLAWAVFFFWRALKSLEIVYFSLTAFSSIFALLSRIEGVFLFFVFFLLLLVLAIRSPKERSSLLKGMCVLVCLPLLLVLVVGVVLSLIVGIDITNFSRFGELNAHFQAALNGSSLDMYHSLYAQLKTFKNPAALGTTGSLAETTRHYIPVIYLISVIEALARNLFPLYVVSFFSVFCKRPTFHRGHWLILLLAGTYFLMAYYRLFTYDFISKRYVLIPAVLLFPWVGLGLERIFNGIAGFRWPQISVSFFLFAFCIVPAYKSLEDVSPHGKGYVIKEAGQWLAIQPDLKNAIIACSDPRIRMYSSPEQMFLREMETYSVAKDFRRMEKVSFEKNAALLIIETAKTKRCQLPEFKHFSLQKEFLGKKNDVLIFSKKL